MPERILFLTGHLAEARLRRVLSEMKPEFGWDVRDIGVQVAALMTADIVRRRLPREEIHADRVLVPGFCAGDLDALSADWGVPVTRGPDDLHDIPEHFGKARSGVDLTRHGVRIFAEIVDAPKLSIEQIVAQASAYAGQGADVIDLGCLPATPFGHLEEAVAALHAAGFLVSVDSADSEQRRRRFRAQPLRSDARPRRRDRGNTDSGSGVGRRSRFALPCGREARALRPALHPRSRAGTDPVWLHGLAHALWRAAEAPARGAHPHGRRQSYGTHGSRYGRHQRDAVRGRRRARHQRRAHGAEESALPHGDPRG